MCRRCQLYGKVLASYGARQPMPCADILHAWDWTLEVPYVLDTAAEEFLRDSLEDVDKASGGVGRLVPIQVTGDGNCLAHSISRACHAEEMWYSLLRKKVQAELRDNEGATHATWPHTNLISSMVCGCGGAWRVSGAVISTALLGISAESLLY